MHHGITFGEYMPHGMCLLWKPWLVILWAGSDLLIFLSYTAIPFALFRILRRRSEVPHPGLVALFASFILFCGLTHLMGIITLWYPIYPVVGLLKLATGLVSAATAIALFRLVPDIVRLPSPAALEAANRELRDEIAAHRATLASLEVRVKERTQELEDATTALAVQAREMVHRSSNLLTIVQVLATQTAQGAERTSDFLPALTGRLRALADATRAIARNDQASAEMIEVVEAGLTVLKATHGAQIAASGPKLMVSPTAAQQLSLAIHELATNTQKYGLGLSEGGSVTVSWTADNSEFVFLWHEEGESRARAETTPQTEGFGSKLLNVIVPAMLDGEAQRSFERRKMTYRLVAPLKAVEAHATGSDTTLLADRIIDASFGLG